MTPVALRAPEIILKRPVDESIDIWSFGCLIYELLTGNRLFSVYLIRDDEVDDTDDDHLLELNDILGDLPDDMMAAWTRSEMWFGPNRERLNPRAQSLDRGEERTSKDSHEQAGEKSELKQKPDGGLDRIDGDDLNDGIKDEELFINKPLEVLFEENKPDDVDGEEAAAITKLIRRILKYDPSERPSAKELLEDKWFEDV